MRRRRAIWNLAERVGLGDSLARGRKVGRGWNASLPRLERRCAFRVVASAEIEDSGMDYKWDPAWNASLQRSGALRHIFGKASILRARQIVSRFGKDGDSRGPRLQSDLL